MLLAVTGSREIVIQPAWEQILREFLERATMLVHGACPHPKKPKIEGAVSIDTWADEIARDVFRSRLHLRPASSSDPHPQVVLFPADWSLGPKGGPLRNAEMAHWCAEHVLKPKVLLAFPGNTGTRSCMREFRKVGICIETILELVARGAS